MATYLAIYVLLFFVALRQFDIFVWIDERNHIYPSSRTNGHELPLSISGIRANSVWYVDVRVSNFGSNHIGEQGSLWTLDVSVPSAELIALTGSPEITPSSIKMSVFGQPAPNVLRFELGVFEPTDELRFGLMTVNADYPTINASASLKGLPDPNVSTTSLTYTLADRFGPLAAVVAFIFLLYQVYQSRSEFQNLRAENSLLKIAGMGLLWLVVGFFSWAILTAVSALALGWVAATILRVRSIYPRLLEMIPWL